MQEKLKKDQEGFAKIKSKYALPKNFAMTPPESKIFQPRSYNGFMFEDSLKHD